MQSELSVTVIAINSKSDNSNIRQTIGNHLAPEHPYFIPSSQGLSFWPFPLLQLYLGNPSFDTQIRPATTFSRRSVRLWRRLRNHTAPEYRVKTISRAEVTPFWLAQPGLLRPEAIAPNKIQWQARAAHQQCRQMLQLPLPPLQPSRRGYGPAV